MKTRGLMGAGVALAMFFTSAVEGFAYVGAPASSAPVSFVVQQSDQMSSAEILQVRAGGKRNVNVNRGGNVNVKRGANVNVKRGANVNVNRGPNVVVRRPVRVWAPRPYYGTIIGGVALGTIIAVSIAATAPTPPASNLCWFWSDSAQRNGYWDYCVPPR